MTFRLAARLLPLLAIAALPARPAAAQPSEPRINEFVADHAGADVNEFVELVAPPGADLSGYSVLVVEGDGSGAGRVDRVFDAGLASADGYWTTGYLTGVLENGTQTLLLVEGFTGAVGDDLDADDDGVLDASPWAALVDAVATHDGGGTDRTYAAAVLDDVGGASRIPDGRDTDAAADWVTNHYDGDGLPCCDDPADPAGEDEAVNTAGAENHLGGDCAAAARPSWDGVFTGGVPAPGQGLLHVATPNGFASVEVVDDRSTNLVLTDVRAGDGSPLDEADLTRTGLRGGADGNGWMRIDYAGADRLEGVEVAVGWLAAGGSVFMFRVGDRCGYTLQVDPRVHLAGDAAEPAGAGLDAPYPSPFAARVRLAYHLPTASSVRLDVFDALGRRVRRIAGGARPAGSHEAWWDGRDGAGARVAPGLYLVRLQAGTAAYVRRVVRAP